MGVIRDTTDLLETAKSMSKAIKGEKSDSLRIECRNNLGIYESTVCADNKFSKWVRKLTKGSMRLPASEVYDVRLVGLSPLGTIRDILRRDEKYVYVDFRPALEYDMFRLEVYYHMDEDWLSSLVRWRSSREPLSDPCKYNLSAQLTNPSGLSMGFSEVDVEDYPVTARVHIQQDISLQAEKSPIKRLLEIESEIQSDYNPRTATRIIGLQREKSRLKKRIGKSDLAEKIRDIQMFLTPAQFSNYISVIEDFRFHKCEWGSEIYNFLGTLFLPKGMDVISRSDLSLHRPAASGVLIYDNSQFGADVQDLLLGKTGKKGHRRKGRRRSSG